MRPALLEIKHCQNCPFLDQSRVSIDSDLKSIFDWSCRKQEMRKIKSNVDWTEAKDVRVPAWCPLRK